MLMVSWWWIDLYYWCILAVFVSMFYSVSTLWHFFGNLWTFQFSKSTPPPKKNKIKKLINQNEVCLNLIVLTKQQSTSNTKKSIKIKFKKLTNQNTNVLLPCTLPHTNMNYTHYLMNQWTTHTIWWITV